MCLSENGSFLGGSKPFKTELISDAFAGTLGLYLPHCYLIHLATSIEHDEAQVITNAQASTLISLINVGNLIGRIFVGFVLDLPWFDTLLVFNVSAGLTGLCMAWLLLARTYLHFAFLSVAYGLVMSCYSSQSSVVLADLFGIKALSSTFGLLSFFRGVACSASLPLAGVLYEAFSSDKAIFILGTTELGLASVIGFILQFMVNRKTAAEGASS